MSINTDWKTSKDFKCLYVARMFLGNIWSLRTVDVI